MNRNPRHKFIGRVDPVTRKIFENTQHIKDTELSKMSGYSIQQITDARKGKVVPNIRVIQDLAKCAGLIVRVDKR